MARKLLGVQSRRAVLSEPPKPQCAMGRLRMTLEYSIWCMLLGPGPPQLVLGWSRIAQGNLNLYSTYPGSGWWNKNSLQTTNIIASSMHMKKLIRKSFWWPEDGQKKMKSFVNWFVQGPWQVAYLSTFKITPFHEWVLNRMYTERFKLQWHFCWLQYIVIACSLGLPGIQM